MLLARPLASQYPVLKVRAAGRSARRAARRYIAIPGAPRGRHSRPPRFLHIRGGAEGPGSPAAAGRARAPTRSDRRTAMGNSGRAREPPQGRPEGKKSGAPEGPAPHLYGSAVHRSAAPCSPTGFPRSTIGARRLSFRVRNGSGRAPPAMAADRWAALRPLQLCFNFYTRSLYSNARDVYKQHKRVK